MSELRAKVQDVFREVFDDPQLELHDGMTAGDIKDWTSLTHVNLIVALEKSLGIKFATAEISRTRDLGADVGTLMRMIEVKAR